jgi:hypothetical protein
MNNINFKCLKYLIVVPGFPAHGCGSAESPGLAGMTLPSQYRALYAQGLSLVLLLIVGNAAVVYICTVVVLAGQSQCAFLQLRPGQVLDAHIQYMLKHSQLQTWSKGAIVKVTAVYLVMVTRATWVTEARASPRKPKVVMVFRSSNCCSLLVVNLSHTMVMSSFLMPWPSSYSIARHAHCVQCSMSNANSMMTRKQIVSP